MTYVGAVAVPCREECRAADLSELIGVTSPGTRPDISNLHRARGRAIALPKFCSGDVAGGPGEEINLRSNRPDPGSTSGPDIANGGTDDLRSCGRTVACHE